MDRSPIFGSTTCYLFALFALAFAAPPPHSGLSLQHTVTRRTILQKVRRHPFPDCSGHRASTAGRYTVSGTISLSSRLCFSPFPHGTRSLSVAKEYLALGGGPPGFRPGSTCQVVLGKSAQEGFLTPTGLSPSMAWLSSHFGFVHLCQTCAPPQQGWRLPRPRLCNACGLSRTAGLGLAPPEGDAVPRSLAATRGVELFFPFLRILRCVNSPRCRHAWLARGAGLLSSRRVAPFGNPRITVCLATSRGLSQLATSFVGSWRQGIHRIP